MTEQRRIIFEVIMESPEHLSAEEIFLRAKKKYPSLAMGTVYRNLKLMEEAGEILHIRMADGADRYDKTTFKHDHMECLRCGQFVDLPRYDLLGFLRERTNMEISSYEISVKGICPDCLRNKTK